MRVDRELDSPARPRKDGPLATCGVYDYSPEAPEGRGYCEVEGLGMRVECDIEVVIWILQSRTIEMHADRLGPGRIPVVGCHALTVISIPARTFPAEIIAAKSGVLSP